MQGSEINLRIIPCLQLLDGRMVKTTAFKNPRYIGDPLNTVRIFNELAVDELCFLDIRATVKQLVPDYDLLQQISDECFMPLSYGGGIKNFEIAKKILACGFEKIVIGTAAHSNIELIKNIAGYFGSQSAIAAIDVGKNWLGRYKVMSHSGTKFLDKEPIKWAQQLEAAGAGEILLTSINREGSWNGFDISLTKKIADAVNIPVIAHGGAGSVAHIKEIKEQTSASAVALGSMVLYQQKNKGVLINFPKEAIEAALNYSNQG